MFEGISGVPKGNRDEPVRNRVISYFLREFQVFRVIVLNLWEMGYFILFEGISGVPKGNRNELVGNRVISYCLRGFQVFRVIVIIIIRFGKNNVLETII